MPLISFFKLRKESQRNSYFILINYPLWTNVPTSHPLAQLQAWENVLRESSYTDQFSSDFVQTETSES